MNEKYILSLAKIHIDCVMADITKLRTMTTAKFDESILTDVESSLAILSNKLSCAGAI